MKHIFYLFLLALFSWQTANAQCTSPIGNRLGSKATGNWNTCGTWLYGNPPTTDPCPVWSTLVGSNFGAEIRSPDSVSVSGSIASNLAGVRDVVVFSGAKLYYNLSYTANTSGTYKLQVCGVLRVAGGTVDYSNHDLIVESGGSVYVTGGTLRVNSITVKNNGNIYISGSGILSRDVASNGFVVDSGGTVTISGTSARLSYHGVTGTLSSKIHGTLDLTNSMTGSNSTNVQLGKVFVESFKTKGRIRTQTAHLCSVEFATEAANNFFGFNSDYGGTVEFYGMSSITLTSSFRTTVYDVEVNLTGGANLSLGTLSCLNIVGNLYLTNGNLNLNGQRLILRGTILYNGTSHINPSVFGGEIVFAGKIGFISDPCNTYSSGITTNLPSTGGTSIRSQGGWVDIKAPQLRLSAAVGGAATLRKLTIWREDVVHLRSNLTVTDTLHLRTGVLRTYPSPQCIVTVTNTDSSGVIHNTTGFTV
ncbi:MAG: hypothetical protein NZ108_02775, partial [Bacteroidia bacterium]|nr:hypothetical protein [Bacteroidia bacterium]